MKKFTVIWTYIANYGVHTVEARSAKDAVDKATGFYSEDFQRRASVYAFAGEPDFAVVREERSKLGKVAEGTSLKHLTKEGA